MMYKAKVAVCSDIRTKHSTQSGHRLEFLNIKTFRYVKKPLGFKSLMGWPPRSPDLTPCHFFFWGLWRALFVPPLPYNLQDLRSRITATVALAGRDKLTRVWNEMDYRIDVCRITKGGHIEQLWSV